jgi:transitional endoplasmic reticulum ATPase
VDDATIASLTAALAATPENQELRALLVRAHLDRDEPGAAYRLVQDLRGELLDAAHALIAARACLAAGHADEALAHLSPPPSPDRPPLPEAQVLAARALLALDRNAEGRARYEAAIAKNPALEDVELRARLASTVRSFTPREDRPRLRVISNDDTDELAMPRLLVPEVEPVTFAAVGGLDEIKEQIRRRIILPFQKPSLFQRFKKRVGGGILLYGPPGCGKKLLARATAGECRASFFNVAIADILDMYIGESERKLHAILEKARSATPAVVFFDELEALGGKRQYTREGTSAKLVSQFLSELDAGFAPHPRAGRQGDRRPRRGGNGAALPPPCAGREPLTPRRPGGGRGPAGSFAVAAAGRRAADPRRRLRAAGHQLRRRSLLVPRRRGQLPRGSPPQARAPGCQVDSLAPSLGLTLETLGPSE